MTTCMNKTGKPFLSLCRYSSEWKGIGEKLGGTDRTRRKLVNQISKNVFKNRNICDTIMEKNVGKEYLKRTYVLHLDL